MNDTIYKRVGVTLIELMCVCALLGIFIALVLPAFQAGYELHGLFIGILWGVIATAIVVITLWALGKMLCFFFPGEPEYCGSRKCRLHDCYHVRLDIIDGGSILYYKCRCGEEYIRHVSKGFLAKVNKDGSLEPHKFLTHPIGGWYRDNRIDSDVYDYAIPMEVLQQLRDENTDRSFVFTDEFNCFELCTHCHLIDVGP
jgi:hypothetical protein